jgi:glutamyl-tRNA synthetase
MAVRTRFAPSPTGSLHVGGARTALYCLLTARHQAGRFLLRIEDTDRARSTEEAAEGILRDLRWLGLDWDEGPGRDAGTGPYFQSERLDLYDRYLHELLVAGKAYEAWDTPEELEAARAKAAAEKRNFRYRRRSWTDREIAAFRAEGRRPVVRLLVGDDREVHHLDEILGPVTLGADDLDDFVLRKADGFPTYHFAVVIDDHLMGVNLVLRGQEHLMNTHKHLLIYEALGWAPPRHGHLPLIFNPGGSKMSKRDKAKAARQAAREAAKESGDDWRWLANAAGLELADVEGFVRKQHDGVATAEAIARVLHVDLPMIEVMDFRRGGYLPEALLNYLALLGWSPGDDREIVPFADLVAAFDPATVGKTPARFDPDKLKWMNGEYIRSSSLDALVDAHASYLEVVPDSPFAGMAAERRAAFLDLYRQRIATFAELDRVTGFFFEAPTTYDEKAVAKHLVKDGGLDRLPALRELLATHETWQAAPLQAALEAWSAEHGVPMGRLAQPIRVAITGTAVSPPIGETLELLGRDATIARLDACVARLRTP